ncbi:hypothetical protein CEXT_305821 [Caerostris extrusa]|uniref:Uncharacterized protein n=1 Tax=Caerostris extrusa TaxID=172846 RepID=A0AAV4Y0L3_CAEEX|nr:hypothetical protein CEXT_305821 [Caerostris extrusa]
MPPQFGINIPRIVLSPQGEVTTGDRDSPHLFSISNRISDIQMYYIHLGMDTRAYKATFKVSNPNVISSEACLPSG